MVKILNRISQPSLRQGVIFGLILGVIEIVLRVAGSFVQNSNILLSVLGTLALSAFLAGGYIAGRRASQETAKLRTGVLAGIWAGLIGCLLEALLFLVIQLITFQNYVAAYQRDFKMYPGDFPGMRYSDITASYVLTGLLIGFAINLFEQVIFYIPVALAGGALGGFLGRRRVLTYVGVEPQAKMAMESERGTDVRDLAE